MSCHVNLVKSVTSILVCFQLHGNLNATVAKDLLANKCVLCRSILCAIAMKVVHCYLYTVLHSYKIISNDSFL